MVRATRVALAVAIAGLPTFAACAIGADSPRRGSIRSAAFVTTPQDRWTHDLGYGRADLHPLTISPSTGCPQVDVGLGGVRVSLLLDTGTARGFMITDHAPALPYTVEEVVQERNADGSPRGRSEVIHVDSMEVLGVRYSAQRGSRADWRMFSSVPFDGTVGLDFFLDRRLTLDCHARLVAVSPVALPRQLDPERYAILDLLEPPGDQGHVLYVRGVVSGRPAIIYLDTGRSSSAIDPAFCQGLERIAAHGKTPALRRGVPLELGGHRLVLDDLREEEIRRGGGLDAPVALELGSDVLSRLVTTVDLRTRKLVLALAQ